MELGTGTPSRYKKITFWRDSVLDLFLEAHPVEPAQIMLDIAHDGHGAARQSGAEVYHVYYRHHSYLPLYIFCGDHVLCSRLRPSSVGPAVGSRKEVQRIVQQIRQR